MGGDIQYPEWFLGRGESLARTPHDLGSWSHYKGISGDMQGQRKKGGCVTGGELLEYTWETVKAHRIEGDLFGPLDKGQRAGGNKKDRLTIKTQGFTEEQALMEAALKSLRKLEKEQKKKREKGPAQRKKQWSTLQ